MLKQIDSLVSTIRGRPISGWIQRLVRQNVQVQLGDKKFMLCLMCGVQVRKKTDLRGNSREKDT